MPRQGRIHLPGGIYHVIARGIERAKIFKDKHDREEILRRLAKNLKKTECRCYAWVLMSNHFHLLIRAGQHPLSDLKIAFLGHRYLGITLTEIAIYLGISNQAVSKSLSKSEETVKQEELKL